MCAYSVFNTFPVYPLSAKPLILLAFCRYRYHTSLFNRPGFSELLKDIKSGKINAVIVKDFSRFGRNYLEALELLDVVFPELDVRFISIDDGYDSADPQCSKERMVYVIKHLANEYYARISSKKLTQAHELARGLSLIHI